MVAYEQLVHKSIEELIIIIRHDGHSIGDMLQGSSETGFQGHCRGFLKHIEWI